MDKAVAKKKEKLAWRTSNSHDNHQLRLYLLLFAEYDGEAEDGWSRYRCEPEHEKTFEEYTRRKQVRWR